MLRNSCEYSTESNRVNRRKAVFISAIGLDATVQSTCTKFLSIRPPSSQEFPERNNRYLHRSEQLSGDERISRLTRSRWNRRETPRRPIDRAYMAEDPPAKSETDISRVFSTGHFNIAGLNGRVGSVSINMQIIAFDRTKAGCFRSHRYRQRFSIRTEAARV